MRFEIFQDAAGEYRWRLLAANNQTLADSGEGYASLRDCRGGITKVKRTNSGTPVEVREAAK